MNEEIIQNINWIKLNPYQKYITQKDYVDTILSIQYRQFDNVPSEFFFNHRERLEDLYGKHNLMDFTSED